MNFPPTRKEPIVDQFEDIKVSDAYRWLEDSNSVEVEEWIKSQNVHTNFSLKNVTFDIFSKELVENFKVTTFSSPVPVRGRYFYVERRPNEDQSVLYVKNGLEGEPIKLVDPNEMDDRKTASINFWSISRSGKYVAYGISNGGTEMATLYVKNVEINKDLPDTIDRCRYSSVKWLPDDSGFYYTRNPHPSAVPKGEEHLHTKVYFHALGKGSNEDELIFGKDRPKNDMIRLGLSLDGRYLSIHVTDKWTENEIYIYDREDKKTTPLVTKIPAEFKAIFLKDKILLKTNYKANNYRVLYISISELFKPIDEWKEFISEQDNRLESIAVTKDKILVEYLHNACSKVLLFDYKAKNIGEIPLPQYSSLAGISTWPEELEFFYGLTSFTFPMVSYRYDPQKKEFTEYRKTDNPVESKSYIVSQEWYRSKDGTKVPLFILHKRWLKKNSSNPTILWGYGGFGNIQTPVFMRNWISWLERGGVITIANIRGGGEFGKNWHEGGIKENKQKSFDDFIFAAKYLIDRKYTSADHLGIAGGSNGGLLVCAVAMQEPGLFKAVKSAVPLTDMVRFFMFGIAARWIHEYGNPIELNDLKRILKWSPYHNIKQNIFYPSFLFTTAENDTRVHPLHARKMTAVIQEQSKNKKVFLYTEADAGHGSGKPIWKIVENQALTLAFFAKELGLKID